MASCNPSGARPIGSSTADPPVSENYAHRTISQDGNRLFFDSYDRVLPQDTSGPESFFEGLFTFAGKRNVYEYEGGHVYLISDGAANSTLTSSTPAQAETMCSSPHVTGSCHRTAMTTWMSYAARVGGGFPQSGSPAACQGEACRGVRRAVPAPPSVVSNAFTGTGQPGGATRDERQADQAESQEEAHKAEVKRRKRRPLRDARHARSTRSHKGARS